MTAVRSVLFLPVCLALLGAAGHSSLTPKHLQRHPKAHHVSPPAAGQKPRANYGQYDFTLGTLDGTTVRLSEYAGKVVLVNIWAPWCGPCRVEMPGFSRLFDRYNKKGFAIISVAVQTNEGDVRSFMQKFNMRWPVGMKDDVARTYGTYGLPDNYLFQTDGTLLKHFIGLTREEAIQPLIEEALKRAGTPSPGLK